MSKDRSWSRTRIRKFGQFIGKRVVAYSVLGLGVGLILSGVEFAFAILIQALLVKVGAISAPQICAGAAFVFQWGIGAVAGFLILTGIVRGGFQGVREYLVGGAVDRFIALQRSRMLGWVFQSASLDTSETIDLFTERTHRAAVAVGALQRITIQLSTAALLVGGLMMLFPGVTLGSLVLLGFASLCTRKVDAALGRTGQALSLEWSQVNRKLVTSIRNLFLIRIYGTGASEESKARQAIDSYLGHSLVYYKLIALKTAAPQIVGLVLLCGIAYFGTRFDLVSGGKLISYFYVFTRLVQSISDLANGTAQFQLNRPQLEVLAKWWADHSPDGVRGFRPPMGKPAAGQLPKVGWEAIDLTFAYPGSSQPVLQGISFRVDAGEALLVLGPSGAGKSTLLNLMTGLISASSGSIRLCVGPGETLSLAECQESLLTSLGYVGPDSFLFDGTILENLLYGIKTPPEPGEIEAVLAKAECGFIHQFPEGLRHRVTDQGDGISAGQKQRLALARALLRKPRALILDEATANLDTDTENRLISTLRALKGEVTLIIVTHREGLLVLADRTIRLKGTN